MGTVISDMKYKKDLMPIAQNKVLFEYVELRGPYL